MTTKRILHVVSNVAHYDDPTHPTGLWLSELIHAYDVFAARAQMALARRVREGVAQRQSTNGAAGIDGAT